MARRGGRRRRGNRGGGGGFGQDRGGGGGVGGGGGGPERRNRRANVPPGMSLIMFTGDSRRGVNNQSNGNRGRRGQRGGGKMRRGGGRNGEGSGGKGYRRVTADLGVQVGCEVAEMTGALLVGAMDAMAAASDSKTDDYAFPLLQKSVGSGLRVFADYYLAKRHAGLAKVASSLGSAVNGAVAYSYAQRQGLKVQKAAKERA